MYFLMHIFQRYNIAPDSRGFLKIFFLFLHQNICNGYSLELPQQGASNEYHNIFVEKEEKNQPASY